MLRTTASANFLGWRQAADSNYFPEIAMSFLNPSLSFARLLLLVAGLLEPVWAGAMKASDGFTKLWPAVLTIVAAWSSFALLGLSLKALPVGTAYAVWTGIDAVGTAVLGIFMATRAHQDDPGGAMTFSPTARIFSASGNSRSPG
ncbi:MAG: multidrug efflux SMR transporter [Rhodocyclaceae bacterium]|nr:multidrug efflux SMR transporter [Rhodocyclaceae bacterium]